jgi:type IV secretory pathway VirB9-like protein
MTNASAPSLLLILFAGTAAFAQSAAPPARPRPTGSAPVPAAASRGSSDVKSAATSPSASGATTPAPTAPTGAVRTVLYHARDLVTLRARVRFTTLIGLPDGDDIVEATCGDKEFWIVNGTANFAYVKPAKANSETNLNLITASGNIYSFVLHEVSESQGAEPDLKVFIEPKEGSTLAAMNAAPKFVPASQIDDRQQAEIAKEQARDAKSQAQATVDREVSRVQSEYPAKLQFPYRFPADDKLFRVSAIYNDGKFTYIRADPQETPSVYEIKDGKPNLINFEFHDGLYVVPKVLDSGYLAIGKKRLNFDRTE